MRILQASTGCARIPDDRLGGIEGHIFITSKKLANMGHEVTILDRKYTKDDRRIEEISQVKVLRFPSLYFSPSPLEKFRVFKFIYTLRSFLLNNMLFTLKCVKYLNRNTDFDIFNVYTFYSALVTSVILKKSLRSKVYYTHMSSLWPQKDGGILVTRLLPFFAKIVVKRIGGTIAQNPVNMEFFTQKLGVPKSAVYLIPSGTDTTAFDIKIDLESVKAKYPYVKDKKVVLFTGRIKQIKGVDLLVKAADILAKKSGLDNFIILCVGPYEEFDVNKPQGFSAYVLKMVKDSGLQEFVKFTGAVPLADLKAFYQLCVVFVLPSRFENCAAVINEAMANSKPIIASKTGGALLQIKDGWNGFLVDSENEVALAEAIKHILEHPIEAEQMGKNSKAYSSDFDWQKITEKYFMAYQGGK